MALIVYVDELPEGLTSDIDDQWKRTYTRKFHVITDMTTGPAYVRNNLIPPGGTRAIGIGQYWSYGPVALPYEVDTGALVKRINPKCTGQAATNPATGAAIVGGGLDWEVEVECGPWNPADHTANGDPTIVPPQAWVEFTEQEVPMTKDVNGSPVLNAAGDPFDPPVMRDQTHAEVHIIENLSAPGYATEFGFIGCINTTAWQGFAPRTLRVCKPRYSKPQFSQVTGAPYWERERVFAFNPDGWDKRVLNCGFRQLGTNASGSPIQETILGGDGQPLTSPAMLDINGHYIPPPYDLDSEADPASDDDIGPNANDGGTPSPSGTPSPVVYLVFEAHNALEFNTAFSYPPTLLGD